MKFTTSTMAKAGEPKRIVLRSSRGRRPGACHCRSPTVSVTALTTGPLVLRTPNSAVVEFTRNYSGTEHPMLPPFLRVYSFAKLP